MPKKTGSNRNQVLQRISGMVMLIIWGLLLSGCASTASTPDAPAQNTSAAVVPSPTPEPPPATPTLPPATPTAAEIPTVAPTPEVEADSPPVTRSSRTVYPQLIEGYVPNPYMGWQDTEFFEKRFEETVSYRRVNWNTLNPAEGVYDWSDIESLRKHRDQPDDKISFRVRTAQPPPWGEGQVMPDWVVNRGAMIVEGDTDLEGVTGTEPLYAGCLFLETHGQFIDAMRQQYDGDPDVAFIDIGTYGTYGEWDSEQYDDEPESLDWHARRRIIDMYIGGQGTRPCLKTDGQVAEVGYDYPGFQQTPLVMPYTPWFQDSLVYATSRRADVGIRHDALGSERHQKNYREQIGSLVAQRWPQAPIIFEFFPESYTPDALTRARDFAIEMHASLIHENFTGRGSNEQIEEILAAIGYRLVLREAAYTAELEPGDVIALEMIWENMGIAPPYYGAYPLQLSLFDNRGLAVVTQQLTPDIRTWLPNQPVQLAGEITLPPDIPTGTYNLRLAFIDPADDQPALNLAIAGRDEAGYYQIGPVHVLP